MATESILATPGVSALRFPPETLYEIIARVVTTDIDAFLMLSPSGGSPSTAPTPVLGLPNTYSLLSVARQFNDITAKILKDVLRVPSLDNASGFDGDECISLLYRYRALSIIPPELQDRLIPTPDDSETLESITGFKAPLLQAYTLLFMASRVVTENTTIRLNGHFRRISNASKFYTEKAVSVIKQIRPTVLRDSVEKFLRKSLLVLFHVFTYYDRIAAMEESRRLDDHPVTLFVKNMKIFKLLEEFRTTNAYPSMAYSVMNGPPVTSLELDENALAVLEGYDPENGLLSQEVMDAMVTLSLNLQAAFSLRAEPVDGEGAAATANEDVGDVGDVDNADDTNDTNEPKDE